MAFSSFELLTSCSKDEEVTIVMEKDKPVTLSCVRPDYLKAGDKVALISPSYHTPFENVQKTAEILRGWGLEPVIGQNVDKLYCDNYAGTIEERISDIIWAFSQPDIKAIICNRGGYGTIQLIDLLTPYDFSTTPKWIVGFSDISTFHGLLTRSGVMSIHGTMSSFIAQGGQDISSTLLRDLLMGQVPQYEVPAHKENILGKASGILVGGNLCTFTPNIHTKADATLGKDLILFIEEIEESMHNIDRQLNILALNGVLSRCKGIILGEFTDCGDEFSYESIEQMLHEYLKGYNIPVLCGFPAGHGEVNMPLIMGAPVTIDVRNDGSSIVFGIDGEQKQVKTNE